MNPSEIFVIGATHHTAPLEARERLAVADASLARLASRLSSLPGLSEFAILSTCNRIEFYGVGTAAATAAVGAGANAGANAGADAGPDPVADAAAGAAAAESVQAAYCAHQGLPVREFERFRLRLEGRAALRHLFEVAAGLDSQMLGETEIFGQVKDAYAQAQETGTAGPILNRIFQKTFQAAKHVRTHTAITAGHVSVANVAVDLAQSIFGSLREIRVLVLGSGDIGEKTSRAFTSRGAGGLWVASRRRERAEALAAELGAEAVDFEERAGRLADCDVVVCSTAAPANVIGTADVRAAMARRPARPLFLIDLAFPRDVEASSADLENVFLYNLDDLAAIAEQNRVAREAEIARCRALLEERIEALWNYVAPRLAAAQGREPLLAEDAARPSTINAPGQAPFGREPPRVPRN